MATYEVLEPGGHARLVSDIKDYANRAGGVGTTQIADESVTSAKLADDVTDTLDDIESFTDPMNKNGLHGELAEGAVLTADDVYSAPPKGVEVYGKSTQDGTPTPDAPVEIKSVDDLTIHANDTRGATWWNQGGRFVKWSGEAPKWGSGFNSWSIAADGRSASIENGTGSNIIYWAKVLTSRKVYFSICITASGTFSNAVSVGFGGSIASSGIILQPNTKTRIAMVVTFGTVNSSVAIYPNGTSSSVTCDYTLEDFQLIDLTAMFGTGNEPSTVAEFEAMFPEPYYPYDPGSWLDSGDWPVSIPLSNHELRSLPDGTRDTLTLTYQGPSEREGWAVYGASLVQRIARTVYDGTQALVKLSDGNFAFKNPAGMFGEYGYSTTTQSLSDRFKCHAAYNNRVEGEAYIWSNYTYFTLADTYTTVELATEWLTANTPEFIGHAATPITHDLGTVELPVNPAPDLTAWADGGSAQPTMAMEYERDVNIVISNMMSAIADAATS